MSELLAITYGFFERLYSSPTQGRFREDFAQALPMDQGEDSEEEEQKQKPIRNPHSFPFVARATDISDNFLADIKKCNKQCNKFKPFLYNFFSTSDNMACVKQYF